MLFRSVVVILYLLVLVGVTIMTAADRKIPIQYANRPTSSKTTGRQGSNIPIKINSSGVIPVIFAVTILSLPQTLPSFLPEFSTTGFGIWVSEFFNYQRPLGFMIYAILIILFTFFYSFIQINPEKIAKNLQQQNAYIPGVRPGLETENYVSKLLFKITVVGALYLLVVASLPIFTAVIFNLPSYVQVGGTSLLIVVGVAIQTTQQIKTDLQGQNYSGFIK